MKFKLPLMILLCLGLSSCAWLTPHKVTVQQGNLLDADKLAAVELGMTRAQVRFLIGSPIINDSFQPSRWDYLYFASRAGSEAKIKRLTLFFEGNVVVRKIDSYDIAEDTDSGDAG